MEAILAYMLLCDQQDRLSYGNDTSTRPVAEARWSGLRLWPANSFRLPGASRRS